MLQPDECLAYASQSEKMAAMEMKEDSRLRLLNLAKRWRELSGPPERLLH
jgi:hypothetical protein